MRSLLLLCVLVGFRSITAAAIDQNDSTLLAQADTLRTNDHCKEATKIYNDLIERHAFEARALLGRSFCSSDYEEQWNDVQKALVIAPKDPYAYFARAQLYEARGMFDRSILDLDDALAHTQDTVFMLQTMNRQAWCRLQVRDLNGALAQVDHILVIDSANSHAVNTKSLVLQGMGRVDEALAEIERFIRMDPKVPEGYLNMAFLLAENGRYQEALAYYDKADDPRSQNDALYYNNRGFVRLKTGDTKGALKDIKRSIGMRPSNSYAYRNLGLAYQAMEQKNEACDAFEHALRLGFTGQYGNEVKDLYDAYCR